MEERLDTYDRLPAGMREYMSFNGHHFSKSMYTWAVKMMRDRSKNKIEPMTKESIMEVLKRNSIEIENDRGYDIPYSFMMAKSDYMGSSIVDEQHLAKFVKDYIDDVDGYSSRSFDEFLAKLIAQGVPIPWGDLL